MEKYKCSICGKEHKIYRGLEMPAPDRIFELSEEERKSRVKKWDGFYFLDDKYFFVNGYINIALENHEFPFFYWKVWASISHKQFLEKLDELKTGKKIEFDGNLEDSLLFYPNSKGLKLKAYIRLTNEDIIIEFVIVEDSILKNDQAKPISKDRMIELMEIFCHNKANRDKKFDKPFSDRLRYEMLNAENIYIDKNKDFTINVCGKNEVLFQIVSNAMLESGLENKKGFGLHLSFDQSFDDCKKEIKKFRKTKYANEFDYHELDEIPTYQIDVGNDKKRLEELIKGLIIEVYEEELELIDLDNFEI